MEIQAEVTLEDFKAFRSSVLSRGQKRTFIVNLLIGVPIGVAVVFVTRMTGFRLHLPTLIGAGVAFAIVLLFYVHRAMRRQVPLADGTVLGKKTFVVSEGALVEEGQRSRSEIFLHAVKSLVETRHHFFVMVDRNTAYIVPKRHLQTEQDITSFRNFFTEAKIQTETA